VNQARGSESFDSAYIQKEVSLGRAHRKSIMPIVDKRVEKIRLGRRTEVEWLEIDLYEPVEVLTRVTHLLQPMVPTEVTTAEVQPSAAASRAGTYAENGALDDLVVIGIGLLLGLLTSCFAFDGKAGGD
jgi:hypothetical protein